MLTCGLSEVVITPPLGSAVPGQFFERYSTAVKDDLYVKAIVLDDGGHTIALAVCDAVDLARSLVDQARSQVSSLTGIARQNIVISATHTHTGGPSREAASDWEIDAPYRDWLVTRIVEALTEAHRKRRPSRIGFGIGHEDTVAFNRRYHMRDGTVRTNPGIKNNDVVGPVGPIDPQVQVIRIDDLDGRPRGVLTNYSCHPDTVGGTEHSADFPGAISTAIKQGLGHEVISVYLQGACGDINHVDVSGEQSTRDPDHYLRIGHRLGAEALRTRQQVAMTDMVEDIAIGASAVTVDIDYRSPTPGQIAAARATVEQPELPIPQRLPFAEQVLELASGDYDPSTEAEITVFSLGPDTAIVCLPAEIFVELGQRIKRESPFRHTIINELSNASIYGYICTRVAYDQGGYEPALRRFNRTAEDTGERLVTASLDLLHELHRSVTERP